MSNSKDVVCLAIQRTTLGRISAGPAEGPQQRHGERQGCASCEAVHEYTVEADVPHWQCISLGGSRYENVQALVLAPCAISCNLLTDPGGSCNAEAGQTRPIFLGVCMLQ